MLEPQEEIKDQRIKHVSFEEIDLNWSSNTALHNLLSPSHIKKGKYLRNASNFTVLTNSVVMVEEELVNYYTFSVLSAEYSTSFYNG